MLTCVDNYINIVLRPATLVCEPLHFLAKFLDLFSAVLRGRFASSQIRPVSMCNENPTFGIAVFVCGDGVLCSNTARTRLLYLNFVF